MARLRLTDIIQLWATGFGLIFLLTIVVLGQSQDYLNGSMAAQINALTNRVDHIESYMMALVVATISNLIAHIINIRGQYRARKADPGV